MKKRIYATLEIIPHNGHIVLRTDADSDGEAVKMVYSDYTEKEALQRFKGLTGADVLDITRV